MQRLIITSLFVLLGVTVGCGTQENSESKAIADNNKMLGLHLQEVTVDGKKIPAYQFLLCDRFKLLQSPEKSALQDPDICYNPFVDKKKGVPVYLTTLSTEALEQRKLLRTIGKGIVVVGGVALAAVSVKFAAKVWKIMSSFEEYLRYSMRVRRSEKIAKLIKEAGDDAAKVAKVVERESKREHNRLYRAYAWLFGGGITATVAHWFIIGDGAFMFMFDLFFANKAYFDNGRKILYTWGSPEDEYLQSFPYLKNDDWLQTMKVNSVFKVMEGIRKDIGCEYNDRYKDENPLI